MATSVSHDAESVPEVPTNRRFSDLCNLPGEYVAMNSEIFSAMREGDKEFIREMKSYETPMACFKNHKGDTILHVAASLGHLELVESIVFECPSLLLEPNWKGRIPLHVAAHASCLEVVEFLAKSIARFSDGEREILNPYVLKDINEDTPLHLAMKDLKEETEFLMKQCIRSRGFINQLVMYLLCSSVSKEISDTLTSIAKTATFLVNAKQCVSFLANKDGISPLYLAVKAGNLSLVNAMLGGTGNNLQGQSSSNLTSQLEGRKSLVHVALKSKNKDVLDVILNEFPDLVKGLDEEGQTCLSVGASVGFSEGIRKVLDLSTSVVFECDKDGSFPIHKAVEKDHVKVVKTILRRCPNSIHQLNKKCQNVLHIAAKSGNSLYFLMHHIKSNHLIWDQDVDGNTPLHLATKNWRPRAVATLIKFDLPLSKSINILRNFLLRPLDIQNKDGLRPLDIAEKELHSNYVFRERMTLMVLLCVYKPKGVYWIPTSGMTLRSKSDKDVGAKKYKDCINILLLVAALVATITFAAGFTMPGGFNSSPPDDLNSSAPYMGMATLANKRSLSAFLICDTLAMQCSLITIVALVWAQLGDQNLAHRAFHLALPSLFCSLICMSCAFAFGVSSTTQLNTSLTLTIMYISTAFTFVMILFLAPYVVPQLHDILVLESISKFYLITVLWFVNEDDGENPYTSSSRRSKLETLRRFIKYNFS